MKKIILFTAVGFLSLTSTLSFAQDSTSASATQGPNFAKLDASPMDLIEYKTKDKEVVARIIYSRPQKRDRQVFGNLVPYGEVWRTGANESTELTLYKDVKIANNLVKAGTYTIYTIPQENEWTIILNNSVHTWGAYEYTDKKDMVRITVPVKQSPTSIESFSMAFEPTEDGASLLAGWDNKFVEVPFTKAK
ncbi:Protein of unknown function [Gillisia sp. Hel1_33_143]|uniref:DUF2911 domain-containing protein n=1 Tax=unclassified Gillisia TaxID=2615025 RepID=UPI00054F1E2A|nr:MULTISPECIES: DUF2911 domain-containing protein [unclassified Gillisia]SDS08565.1 Protein of unknown function [Gillisia sp. Hel1_33_143]